MAIKKSELYSSLWASCDELRGGMDASQYKDYVLVMLFIKYISDKYANVPYAPITVPKGASFKDMVALKGTKDIGDQINKKIIAPLASANKLSDMPDFNDATKLGSDKEMVDRLTNLIAIFENPALDFSRNRADGDDILGDAYEYLMRHFATESGKSKGQFYTPAEVSRVIAQILGIRSDKTTRATSVYDPTCGSGSLLLKVADEARTQVTLYGQEKDAATSGLARMNMILHNNPIALIKQGNTLTDPKFKDGDALKTFDYVVANPPFSDKRWSTGLDPLKDPYERFKPFGVPPAKQGDYAYLLHIVRSLKSTGKGACILPHGVLFRGNAEAEIRRTLVRKGYIKGIIGLPPNLFYGTGIPACIIVIDKQDAQARKGIFMIDASRDFMKDGPKNRLRAQDIHKIVDVFNKQLVVPKYSRLVPFEEIEGHEFNLNLPRYINSQGVEDIQDIEGHLCGGIPERDIDALEQYWSVCPQLRQTLFKPNRPGYLDLTVKKSAIKPTIYKHPEFSSFTNRMGAHFAQWEEKTTTLLKALQSDFFPKELISSLSEDLLAHYSDLPLIDKYDIYQHLMDYWSETMQDDCYLIASDGWKAETSPIIEKNKNGKEIYKGWMCDLIPKPFIVAHYFAPEQAALDQLQSELESVAAQLTELEEEQGGEEGILAQFDKVNKGAITARLKEINSIVELDDETREEEGVLQRWLELNTKQAELKTRVKEAEKDLDAKAYAQYPKLTEEEIKTVVVDEKWVAALESTINGEIDRISQTLTQRVKELTERYETPLPVIVKNSEELEKIVNQHLKKDGVLMDVKAGYKQTEVGVIPEDWHVKTVDQISVVGRGRVISHREIAKSTLQIYPVYSSQTSNNGVMGYLDTYDFEGEYITWTTDGANAGTVFHRNGKFNCTNVCGTIKLKSDSYALVAKILGKFAPLHVSRQLGNPKLMNDVMKKVKIPLPPTKAEQNVIAKVLSEADAYIESLEQLITKKRQIKQGALQVLLQPNERWVEKRLSNTATLKARIGWQGLTTAEYLDDGDYLLVTGTEFKGGYIDWENCHYVTESRYKQDKNIQLKAQDVLVTKDGTIGKVAFVNHLEKPATLNSGVFVIRPINNAFHPEFFYYLLTSKVFIEFLNQLSAGSTINHLYQKDFVNFVYQTPKMLEEQETIAAILSDMDEEISLLEGKLNKAHQIKQGMMEELLTGRIRLT